MLKRLFTFYLLIICLVANASTKNKINWNRWGGPNGNFAVSEEINPHALDSFQVVWTKNVGAGHSNILIVEDKAYFSGWEQSIEGSDTSDLSTLYCVDAMSGEEIWTYTYHEKKRSFPGTRATPLIEKDRLYNISTFGEAFCISIKDGSLVWKNDISNDSIQKYNDWGFNSSPVSYKNLILLNIGHAGLALQKKDGSVAWRSEDGKNVWSSTVLTQYRKKDAALFLADSLATFVNPKNGKELYAIKLKSPWSQDPLIGDHFIFFGNAYYKWNNGKEALVWNIDSISSPFSSAAIIDGYSYHVAMEQQSKMYFTCVEIATGKQLWKEKARPWGSVTKVGKHILFLEGKGKLHIVKPNTEKLEIISGCQALDFKQYKGDFAWTAPSIYKGKIYVRSFKGVVTCIEAGVNK